MDAQAQAVERIRAGLRSRRMQERFFHLRFYEDEPAARSLLVGIELTEAALAREGSAA